MPFDSKPGSGGSAPQIAIIGTGFAGLGMAIQLRKAGIEDFVILEKAGDVGGTWRDNHYPGCACDVQSHLYSFSFEPNPNWSRMFPLQSELWDYLHLCTKKYGLMPKIRFNRQVVGANYNEASGEWALQVAEGRAVADYMAGRGIKPGEALDVTDPAFPARETVRAKVIVSGMGGLSVPAYPKINGLENFRGVSFHSQDWRHDVDLSGKRVAVIGTGASAIQFVPQVQKQVARLDLYQRTPPWIVPKPDRAVTRFERWLFRHLPFTQRLFRAAIYVQLEFRALAFVVEPRLMHLLKQIALLHIRRQIKSPGLREKVTPDYMLGCKRVLISDDYYPALNQPNVDVITDSIREVTAHGVVTGDGTEREVDCIIFGTGFHATDPLPRGVIFGRGGQDILDAWREGPEAFRGCTISGFPNLFMLAGPNTGLGHSSMVYMLESQIHYVLDAIRLMRKRGLKAVEVRPEVQAGYNRKLQARLDRAIWSVGGCRSWYKLPNGKNVTLWPGFTWQFRRLTRRFDTEAYQLEPATRAAPTRPAAV